MTTRIGVIPVYNASVKAARDEHDQIIGVTICCLFTHDQISELPKMFMERAHNVLDVRGGKMANNQTEEIEMPPEHVTGGVNGSSPDIEPEVIKAFARAVAEIQRAVDWTHLRYVSDHCSNALDEIKHAIRAACGPVQGKR